MSQRDTLNTFISAFQDVNIHLLTKTMAKDIINYVTNSEGGVDRVVGPQAYADRLMGMKTSDAAFTLTLTQVVQPRPNQLLAMVEVKAKKPTKSLHNFSAFLLTFNKEGLIQETWMAEALPQESERFWTD